MIFDVYRFATGVTSASQHDPQQVTAALANPKCLGVVAPIEARNEWDAIDRARRRFLALDFTLGPAGAERCRKLLAQRPDLTKGGVQ